MCMYTFALDKKLSKSLHCKPFRVLKFDIVQEAFHSCCLEAQTFEL